MIFPSDWFDAAACNLAWLLLTALLAYTARPAYRALQQYRSAAALAILILTAAWSLTAAPDSGQLGGMSYHLLALNLTALMLGAPAALWLAALLLLPYLYFFGGGIQAYPVNALALLLPPLAVHLLARSAVARLPANLFIFIFVNGFLASALGIIATGLVLVSILDAADIFTAEVLWSTAFPVFFLLAWAEAFLSGITTAIFIALRPHWLNTFDDRRYLKSQNQIW